jgi:putative inorganic carbon (HCO3(-)) transporter
MIPVTIYATTDRQTTFSYISRLLAGLALVYGLGNWAKRGAEITLLVLGTVGAGIGLSLFALVSVAWFSKVKLFLVPSRIYDILPQTISDTIHPNIMAGVLVMLLPFPLAMLLLQSSTLPSVSGRVPLFAARIMDTHWFRRLWYSSATLLMIGILVLTKSRGGWIAGAAVCCIILGRRWPHLLWLIPITLLAIGLLIWRGDPIALLNLVGSDGALSNWAVRLEIWSRAVCMVQDFAVTGIGAGTFQPLANELYPSSLIGSNIDVDHVHNLLLQVAIDVGLPGLVAFLSILLLMFWSALDSARHYQRVGSPPLTALAWAGVASLTGMLIHGMVDATTWINTRGAFVPWAVMGMIVALGRHPEPSPMSVAGHPPRILGWVKPHPLVVGLLVLAMLGAIGSGIAVVLHGRHLRSGSEVNLSLPPYPNAHSTEIHTENPPANSDWTSLLAIMTFSTTAPITDVATFYIGVLEEEEWEMDIEIGDATSWSGIYTQDDGHYICLLSAFDMEGEVSVSIVCGGKEQSTNLPPLTLD